MKVAGVFVSASMMDVILFDGFGTKDVVYGPVILDVFVLASSVAAAAALVGFGCMDSTGTPSPGLST